MKPVFFENGIFPKRQKINYRNVPIYKMSQQNDVKHVILYNFDKEYTSRASIPKFLKVDVNLASISAAAN